MRIFFKSILYITIFLFVLVLFLPKEKIYNYYVAKLQSYNINFESQKIVSTMNGLILENSKVKYLDIKVMKSNTIDINTYFLYSKIFITNIDIDTILNAYLPLKINHITLTHNILKPNLIQIESKFNEGSLAGYINIMDEKVFLKLHPSKQYIQQYKAVMANFKKDESGPFYTYEYSF